MCECFNFPCFTWHGLSNSLFLNLNAILLFLIFNDCGQVVHGSFAMNQKNLPKSSVVGFFITKVLFSARRRSVITLTAACVFFFYFSLYVERTWWRFIIWKEEVPCFLRDYFSSLALSERALYKKVLRILQYIFMSNTSFTVEYHVDKIILGRICWKHEIRDNARLLSCSFLC